MKILGISAFYHDSAASLIIDGELISAAQEERFSRVKGDRSFPFVSISFCLDQKNLSIDDIDYVAFYENPEISFERVYRNIDFKFKNIFNLISIFKNWGLQRLRFKDFFLKVYPSFNGEFFYSRHHESHAAGAYYLSGFKKAVIITLDGVGENTTASIFTGNGSKIKKIREMFFPDSVGLLYTTFTTFLGFKANSGEYKIMGLAPYGDSSIYLHLFYEKLVTLNHDGSIVLNKNYFNFSGSGPMFTFELVKLFKIKPRAESEKIKDIHVNIAAALQKFLEDIVLKMANYAKNISSEDNLCLSGGVALNCVSNGNLSSKSLFKNIWVQPASGDAGNCIGASLNLYHNILGNNLNFSKNDGMKNSKLGPSFTDNEIRETLESLNASYELIEDEEFRIETIINEIINGNIVGIFQDKMEFGPRALGSRSIIGDPRKQNTQTKMNLKIKFRESFRPFAPFVMEEYLEEWFYDSNKNNKYMLFVNKFHKNKRLILKNKKINFENLNEFLNIKRSEVPAVTHVDYSARVQSVSPSNNPFIYKLISNFHSKTGIPFLVNTSFNVRGEPIVCNPLEAYNCLIYTYMDCLSIGSFFLRRKNQKIPNMPPEAIQIMRGLTD